jgi:hypothetical protein
MIDTSSSSNWVHIEILGPYGFTYKPQQPHETYANISKDTPQIMLQNIQNMSLKSCANSPKYEPQIMCKKDKP